MGLIADKIDLIGFRFSILSSQEVFEFFDKFIREGKTHSVFIANAHTLNLAFEDTSYKDILNSADLLLNDGTGVRWAAKLFGYSFKENLVGTDLLPNYIAHCKDRKLRIYLLGSFENTISKAAKNLKKKFPQVEIAGFHHGYFNPSEKSAIIKHINQSHPDILLVGFGNPKQERWIKENINELKVPICIGVGGLFDHLSGGLKRASGWIRRLGIEWLQILLQEPRLKWKRYLLGNPLFIYRIFKSRCLKTFSELGQNAARYIKMLARKLFILFFSLKYSLMPNRKPKSQGIRILTYHRVNDFAKDSFTITSDLFQEHLSFLSKSYTVISLYSAMRMLEKKEPIPPNVVVLTFDDGAEDNYSVVYSLLKKYKLPATFFITIEFIREDGDESKNGFLNWNQLSQMSRDPENEIGSHSITHRSLVNLTQSERRCEIRKSKQLLEARLGKEVHFFSYPFGTYSDFNVMTRQDIIASGYQAAFTSVNGLNTSITNRHELRRTKICRGESIFFFSRILLGYLDNWEFIDRYLGFLQKKEK